ncbi:hypothetical protein JXO52_01660 [bacterium]|nr:hypothetical protein [bacterium]
MIPKITSVASFIFCILLGVVLFFNFQQSLSIVVSLFLALLVSSLIWVFFFDRGIVLDRFFSGRRRNISDITE